MDENEIIEYLKQNVEKGTAFAFMPEEVRHWCEKHQNDKIFMIFDSNGNWVDVYSPINLGNRTIYTIKDDYEPKNEFVPHWEEFEIDEKGFFYIKKESESETRAYNWWYWQCFMDYNDSQYNAFGGWLYIGSDEKPSWYMTPRVDVGGKSFPWSEPDEESKPAYPSKIRFWRYAE